MSSPEIEEFAKALVKHVRDRSIEGSDDCFRFEGDPGERWREAAKSGDLKTILDVVIPDVVDLTVFKLLDAIIDGRFKLSYTADNGKTIDLSKDGESAGWYVGPCDEHCWREKYSQERRFDIC